MFIERGAKKKKSIQVAELDLKIYNWQVVKKVTYFILYIFF